MVRRDYKLIHVILLFSEVHTFHRNRVLNYLAEKGKSHVRRTFLVEESPDLWSTATWGGAMNVSSGSLSR
jgi:hypothetical protein